MIEKSIFSIIICVALFFSLEYHVIANEESHHKVVSQLKTLECCELLRTYEDPKGKGFLIDAESGMTQNSMCTIKGNSNFNSKKRKFSEIIHDSETPEEGENLQERSPDVIMTTLIFTQRIYINQNQVIEVWSQNISSQSRKLFHRLYVRYPDGNVFSSEGIYIEIQPGLSLWTRFTVSNVGKGIGLFDFSCEVWEEVNPSTKKKHDEKNDRYWAKFYRSSGVSTDYYCDDTWHHPSDSIIYERALLIAGGTTSPRDAAIVLMGFVHSYVTPDSADITRTSDIDVLTQRRGDCNDFADLYIGLARSINIPTRIAVGSVFYYNGGESNHLCGAYCTLVKNMGHAWAESYYNGSFHHIDPSWNVIEYPRCYINSDPDIHSVHASAYTACSDSYIDDCNWSGDAERCSNGFIDVTTGTDGGYDTKYYCPSDTDNDGTCDSLDPDRDGDGILNPDDPDPCTGISFGFSNIPLLFSQNDFHVVGDPAYCTDVLGTANLSWVFGSEHNQYSMQRPEGRTDKILTGYEHNTGNLLITGGPAVNGVSQEFDQYFGITYTHNPGISFEITCEGYSIFLDIAHDYPRRDICIVYLGQQNNRNVLLIWGYGWRGTYAGTLMMANTSVWGSYSGHHMLLLEWTDWNSDGLVQISEILVTYP